MRVLLSPLAAALLACALVPATGEAPRKQLENVVEVEVAVKRVSVRPAIFLVENFIDEFDSDSIVNATAGYLAEAEVQSDVNSKGRSSAKLTKAEMNSNTALSNIAKRIGQMTARLVKDQNNAGPDKKFLELFSPDVGPTSGGEFEVVKYDTGGYFDVHLDGVDHTLPPQERVAVKFMTFLEDTQKGGEIVFPYLAWDKTYNQYLPNTFLTNYECQKRDSEREGCEQSGREGAMMDYCCCSELLRVAPKKGDSIVVFQVLTDASIDHSASHASCPVLGGGPSSGVGPAKIMMQSTIFAVATKKETAKEAVSEEEREEAADGAPASDGASGERTVSASEAMGDALASEEPAQPSSRRGKAKSKRKKKRRKRRRVRAKGEGEGAKEDKDEL